jgi:hypothetical protein
LVCSSQNRGTFAHHFQKEEIPSRVLPVDYQKIEYIGRVPGRILAIIGQYLPYLFSRNNTYFYIFLHNYFYCRTCCWREASTRVKRKLLNFKKKGKDEKPFTFSCNVGKILGTQPHTKELILILRRLLLRKKNHFSKAEKASMNNANVNYAKIVST